MSKVAITNVRVFDGQGFCEPSTVIIDGDVIGTDATNACTFDGQGGYLIPGLIDAHVHVFHVGHLQLLSKYGVTTALDMASPVPLINSFRGTAGVTDIHTSGVSATSPGSKHSCMPGRTDSTLLKNGEEARQFINDRVSERADFIKVIADVPGPDQPTLNALVAAAHENGKLVVAHAVITAAYEMAQGAKVDVITHAPLNKPVDDAFAKRMVAEGRITIPTLTMMKGTAENIKAPMTNFSNAMESVTVMYQAGIPILAGTDANDSPAAPAQVAHGASIPEELQLLADAGLSTLDALRAATVLPAEYFGLKDRSVIDRAAELIWSSLQAILSRTLKKRATFSTSGVLVRKLLFNRLQAERLRLDVAAKRNVQ